MSDETVVNRSSKQKVPGTPATPATGENGELHAKLETALEEGRQEDAVELFEKISERVGLRSLADPVTSPVTSRERGRPKPPPPWKKLLEKIHGEVGKTANSTDLAPAILGRLETHPEVPGPNMVTGRLETIRAGEIAPELTKDALSRLATVSIIDRCHEEGRDIRSWTKYLQKAVPTVKGWIQRDVRELVEKRLDRDLEGRGRKAS